MVALLASRARTWGASPPGLSTRMWGTVPQNGGGLQTRRRSGWARLPCSSGADRPAPGPQDRAVTWLQAPRGPEAWANTDGAGAGAAVRTGQRRDRRTGRSPGSRCPVDLEAWTHTTGQGPQPGATGAKGRDAGGTGQGRGLMTQATGPDTACMASVWHRGGGRGGHGCAAAGGSVGRIGLREGPGWREEGQERLEPHPGQHGGMGRREQGHAELPDLAFHAHEGLAPWQRGEPGAGG